MLHFFGGKRLSATRVLFGGKSRGHRRSKKKSVFLCEIVYSCILMFTLTWITGKELERDIKKNKGEQSRWKKNMKIL